MTERNRKLTVMVSEEELDSYKGAAGGEKIGVSEWVRRTLTASISGGRSTPVRTAPADSVATRREGNTASGPCEHRMPKGSYCKRCERVV